MRNKIAILIMLAAVMTACGTFKKGATLPDTTTSTATITDPFDAVIATLGDWQTLQTGGNIKLNSGSNLSSSVQVRMVRDQAIYISLRPMLGIEVGKLVITKDSLFAVDKVHKRFAAEKISMLTAGIPITVSEVQDIFLGRPFVVGSGTMAEWLRSEVKVSGQANGFILAPTKSYKGHDYSFSYDKKGRITSLDIVPAGSAGPAAFQVKYDDIKSTKAGNIAHDIDVNINVDKKLAFSLDYKNIEWNNDVKIDRNIPGGYERISGSGWFNIFSN